MLHSRIGFFRAASGIVLALALATSTPARDLFVNNELGSDEASGTRANPSGAGGPTRTIARALQLAVSGDRIVIANTGVPYQESVTLFGQRNSGFEGYPFVIEGNGAVLDGRTRVPADVWELYHGDIWRFRPAQLAHAMLYLGETPAKFRRAEQDGRVPALEPLEWSLADGWIWFRVEPNQYPDEYPLTVTLHTVGITLYHVENVVVRDLIVQGYSLDGVNVFDNVDHCRLVDLNCRGNGRSGIAVANAARAIIDGCLIGDNGEAQLLTEGWSRTQVRGSQLLSNTAPAFRNQGAELYIDGKRIRPE